MEEIVKISLLGLFFGTFGTTIGGIIGACLKISSNRMLSFILAVTSGLMTSIVCFELVPEAMKISNIITIIVGLFSGIFVMVICDETIKHKLKTQKVNSILKTGIIVGIGLALHNFPEGLAIGSGFEASLKTGISVAIAIAFHDIPEGICMAVPMKNGGIKAYKVILYTFLSGITTGIGAAFGSIAGNINENLVSLSLAFAAGAMLYIISGELIPEITKLYNGRITGIGNILGIILGIMACNL